MTTTATATTANNNKRWYALVRLDEDGRSVAPQAEEIAMLERELMRQSGSGNFLHTTYGSGVVGRTTSKSARKNVAEQEEENKLTLNGPSRLGPNNNKRAAAATTTTTTTTTTTQNSDGTESAKEGSASPSTTNETLITAKGGGETKSSASPNAKKRKKEASNNATSASQKEKKKENANRGGEESARGGPANSVAVAGPGGTTRELPPGCKPGGPCDHCGALDSPQWRRGPASKPCLCNACGTRFRRTNFLAPLASANNNNNNNNNKDNNKQDNDEEENGGPAGNNNNKRNLDGGSNMGSTKKRSVAAAC